MELKIVPDHKAISPGEAVRFTVLGKGSRGVHWSATEGSIDRDGNYVAPDAGQSSTAIVTAMSKSDPAKLVTATVHVVAPGQVSPTNNVQVAQYSISPGASANVFVEFGTDTNYLQKTWERRVSEENGAASLLVAGMKSNTAYHMRGIVEFTDGSRFVDGDQSFLTGSVPSSDLPAIVATTTPGMTPQSGVELMSLLAGPPALAPVGITDLAGNILWSYNPEFVGLQVNPSKMMPDGNILINFSSAVVTGASSILREVDWTGAVVWQLTAADLNAALAQATCAGCNITVIGTHHDFAELPNGHLIVIASQTRTVSGMTVWNDVIIDLDRNRQPVWVWNEFDRLDLAHHPFGFPDWTHTNAVIYSPTDGNLIVSMKNQNWLVKVDYANGTGSGSILWRLGYQGDFTLMGGTDPTDWFYGQHGPSFASKVTAGQFSLLVFDNGDDRVFPAGVICGAMGAPPCLYSTVPFFQIDETARTATLGFHPVAPSYNFFGGDAVLLKNGDIEFCETAGDTYAVTNDTNFLTVWKLQITGELAYRNERLPSFYPGVQW